MRLSKKAAFIDSLIIVQQILTAHKVLLITAYRIRQNLLIYNYHNSYKHEKQIP